MSDRPPRRARTPEGDQEVDLNLAPIIDCFTVLITYLLVSASFIALSVFDVDVATPPGASSPDQPKVVIAVEMEQNRDLRIRVSGGTDAGVYMIAAKDGLWDFDMLTAKLEGLKTKYPELKSALLGADATMEYKEVVKTVETMKKTLPSVTLGEKQGQG